MLDAVDRGSCAVGVCYQCANALSEKRVGRCEAVVDHRGSEPVICRCALVRVQDDGVILLASHDVSLSRG